MDDKQAWEEMWARKEEGRDMFAHAELVEDVESLEGKTIKAGTKVLITVLSRFGDVGIRDYQVDDLEHGYNLRVSQAQLKNINFLSDGGNPWRKKWLEEFAKLKKDAP